MEMISQLVSNILLAVKDLLNVTGDFDAAVIVEQVKNLIEGIFGAIA